MGATQPLPPETFSRIADKALSHDLGGAQNK
jgi:hypothetical protein